MKTTLAIALMMSLLLLSNHGAGQTPSPTPPPQKTPPKTIRPPVNPALQKQLETEVGAQIARRQFRRAITTLNKLYRLLPETRYLSQLAGCYQRLKKPFNALVLYAEYLRRERDPKKRAAVKREVTRLAIPIGRTANRHKARGRLKDALKYFLVLFRATGIDSHLLEAGTLYEQLQRPFLAMRVYTDLQSRQTTPEIAKQIPHRIAALKLQLYKTHGEVRISTTPPGASIIVAGKTHLETTPATIWLSHGKHELVLKKGSREVRRIVDVSAGLRVVDVAIGEAGYLRLVCHHVGAIVTVDNRMIGRTPLASPIPLSPGKHLLEIRAESGDAFAREIDVAANQTITVTAVLGRDDQSPQPSPRPEQDPGPYRPQQPQQRYPDLQRPQVDQRNRNLQQLRYHRTTQGIETGMWVTLSTGLLATGVGGAMLYLYAKKSNPETTDGSGTTTTKPKSKTMLYAGIGTIAAGGALLTTSLILYFVYQKRRSYRRRPNWGIGPSYNAGALGISGTVIF